MTGEETTILKQDSLGRITVPKEKREEYLDLFEASVMSGVEFAKHHGIAVTTFASWIQKRRRERGDYEDEAIRKKLRMGTLGSAPKKQKREAQLPVVASESKEPCLHFIEVGVDEEQSEQPLEVVLPSGVILRISSTSQLSLLKSIVTELC